MGECRKSALWGRQQGNGDPEAKTGVSKWGEVVSGKATTPVYRGVNLGESTRHIMGRNNFTGCGWGMSITGRKVTIFR